MDIKPLKGSEGTPAASTKKKESKQTDRLSKKALSVISPAQTPKTEKAHSYKPISQPKGTAAKAGSSFHKFQENSEKPSKKRPL